MLQQKFFKMKLLVSLSIILIIAQQCVAPPVSQTKEEEKNEHENIEDDKENVFEYQRYLKEVVEMLESDPDFRDKLQKAGEDDIRTGKIANELNFVNHKVRSRLHEVKRREIERLRHLATKEYELSNNLNFNFKPEHLDHSNPHTFEIHDLKKLILKATSDLAEADKRRRAEFKEYEMQKKFDEEQKLKGNTVLSDEERKKFAEELEQMKEKHKKHEPLHHPGSKQQLEEVWEKQDHMDSQEFDPRTFFSMHDVDGNGVWDPDEVKALFLKDVNKMYTPGAPEDDPRERDEELERMREHVFNEFDLDRDGLINYHEFLTRTKDPHFQQDSGWKSIDEDQLYTQEEYEAFERQRQLEMQRQMAQGAIPHQDNPAMHQQYPYQQVPYNPHQPQHQVPQTQGQVPPSDYHYQGQMGQQNYQQPQQNIQHQQNVQQQNFQHMQQNIQNPPQNVYQSQQNINSQPHINQQQNTHSQQPHDNQQQNIHLQQPYVNQQQNIHSQQINDQVQQVNNNNNNNQPGQPIQQEDSNKIVNNQASAQQSGQNNVPRTNQV